MILVLQAAACSPIERRRKDEDDNEDEQTPDHRLDFDCGNGFYRRFWGKAARPCGQLQQWQRPGTGR